MINVKDSVFVITGDNWKSVESKIYGFCITDEGKAIKNGKYSGEDMSKAIGVFCFVNRCEDGKVYLTRNKCGGMPIYYYREPNELGYWAISNSFWKLCEEVSKKNSLTLNESFAINFFFTTTITRSFRETVANEIIMLDPEESIIISEKGLEIQREKLEIHSVPINSIEAINILDRWISKYATIIRSFCDMGIPLTISLSGGFDSRITFALALASGIDLNAGNVQVYSIIPETEGEKLKMGDDYEKASEIADLYGFELNKKPEIYAKSSKISGEDSLRLFHCFMSSVHKEPQFKKVVFDGPKIYLGGAGGEAIRCSYGPREEFYLWLDKNEEFNWRAYEQLFKAYDLCKDRISLHTVDTEVYLKAWNQNHFGVDSICAAMINQYQFMPLHDEELLKIDPNVNNPEVDYNVIFALILDRICPEILDITFTYNGKFSEETIQCAKEINKLKPKREFYVESRKIDLDDFYKIDISPSESEDISPEELVEQYFNSEENQRRFDNKFGRWGKELRKARYNYYIKNNNSAYYPTTHLMCFAVVMRMLEIEEKSSPYNNEEIFRKMQAEYKEKAMERMTNEFGIS